MITWPHLPTHIAINRYVPLSFLTLLFQHHIRDTIVLYNIITLSVFLYLSLFPNTQFLFSLLMLFSFWYIYLATQVAYLPQSVLLLPWGTEPVCWSVFSLELRHGMNFNVALLHRVRLWHSPLSVVPQHLQPRSSLLIGLELKEDYSIWEHIWERCGMLTCLLTSQWLMSLMMNSWICFNLLLLLSRSLYHVKINYRETLASFKLAPSLSSIKNKNLMVCRERLTHK